MHPPNRPGPRGPRPGGQRTRRWADAVALLPKLVHGGQASVPVADPERDEAVDQGEGGSPVRLAQPARPLDSYPQEVPRCSRIVGRDEAGKVVAGAKVRCRVALAVGQLKRATEQGNGLEDPAHRGERRRLRDQGIGDHPGILGAAGELQRGIRRTNGRRSVVVERVGAGELGVERAELAVADLFLELIEGRRSAAPIAFST